MSKNWPFTVHKSEPFIKLIEQLKEKEIVNLESDKNKSKHIIIKDQETLLDIFANIFERALPDLSRNIKCGNSLIGSDFYHDKDMSLFDEDEMIRVNTFDWDKEFPEIFQGNNPGFDVVIGNPPYLSLEVVDNGTKDYLKNKSAVFAGKADILYFFIEKGIQILNKYGLLGYITSRYFLEATFANLLRKFITEKCHIKEIIDFKDYNIFEGVGIHTSISILTKNKNSVKTKIKTLNAIKKLPLTTEVNFKRFNTEIIGVHWILADEKEIDLLNKIELASIKLGELATIEQGQKSGLNTVFGINNSIAETLEQEPLKKLIKNSHINRYYIDYKNVYLIYTDDNFDIEKYPKIKSYFNQHKNELKNRAEAKDDLYSWYRLQRPRNKNLFETKEKIVVPYRAEYNKFAYDDQMYFNDGGDIRIIVLNEGYNYSLRYCLGILNSALMNFYYSFIGRKKGRMYEYFVEPLKKIPIRTIDFNNPTDKAYHDKMVSLVDEMLTLNKQLAEAKTPQIKTVLQRKIEATDSQIDHLVYELYGLTDKEIKIVEGQTTDGVQEHRTRGSLDESETVSVMLLQPATL